MAKLRSPILGYNHNIRFRGLVFHVQTEDSGVANPHVFTHLFHGGVILTTRKLVYDPSASDDAVKALMQAQHKAVLRDLKRGLFDDKIDQYLGGTEGLLPRGADDGGGDAGDAPAAAAPAPVPATADATVPTPAPASVPVPEAVAVRARTGSPGPASVSIPAPTRATGRMPAMSPPTPMAPGDAATPPGSAPAAGPHERAQTQVMGSRQALATPPPVVVTRPSRDSAQPPTRREVSAAFQAIMVGDGEAPSGGGLVEVPDEPAEIHAAAPASAPPLPGVAAMPGARASEYAQHRRRESAPAIDLEPPPAPTAPRPAPRTTPPPAVVSAEARALRQSSSMPVQRPSAPPPIPPAPPASPPPLPPSRPSAPVLRTPQARAPSTPPPTFPPRAPTVAARPRSATSSGVVVTRPAVIVGAPPRNIGGTAAPPPAAVAPPAAAAPPPAGRVRVAREDSESGMFGQDLISEKSLDEVILAYLSEDPSD